MSVYVKERPKIYSDSDQLLVNQHNKLFQKQKRKAESGVGLQRFSILFPHVLTGKTFINDAIKRFDAALSLEALAIRIQHPEYPKDENTIAKIRIAAAEVIQDICNNFNGTWGLLDQEIIGCVFPELVGNSFIPSEYIVRNFSNKRSDYLTIGIATFPTVHFTKQQTIYNAIKASEHALLQGLGKIVTFNATTLNIIGDRLYQQGDIKGAIHEYQMSLVMNPFDANVYNSLAVCYGSIGQFEKAIKYFQSAIRLNPNDPMSYYNAGLIYSKMNQKERALDFFIQADQKGNQLADASYQIGKLYFEMSDIDNALKYLEKTIRIAPNSANAYRYFGQCYEALNMTDKAIYAYKKAIALNPFDALSISAMGSLFDSIGENPEISTLFCEHSVKMCPENGLLWFRLGNLYFKHHRFQDALKAFMEANHRGHDSSSIIKMVREKISEQEMMISDDRIVSREGD